jgi:hypothetical protein
MENKGWKHKLVGGQKKLDLNKNGKLDAEDFKMLRSDKMETGGEVGDLKWVKRGDMYFANGKNKYDIVKGLNSYTLNVNGKVKSKGGLKVMKAYAIDLEKSKMETGGTADSAISSDPMIGGTMASSMANGGGVGKDYKIQNFLDIIRIADNSIKLEDITVDATPKGNWIVYHKGNSLTTVKGNLLDEETIDKYDLKHYDKYAKGGGVEEGATIRIEETPYMASFSSLYGKDLVIKDIKNVYFASGPQKYFIVEVDGEEYEVPERFVKKYEDGGMMETGGGVDDNLNLGVGYERVENELKQIENKKYYILSLVKKAKEKMPYYIDAIKEVFASKKSTEVKVINAYYNQPFSDKLANLQVIIGVSESKLDKYDIKKSWESYYKASQKIADDLVSKGLPLAISGVSKGQVNIVITNEDNQNELAGIKSIKLNETKMETGGGVGKKQIYIVTYAKLNERKFVGVKADSKEEALRQAEISRGYYGINNQWQAINVEILHKIKEKMENGGEVKDYTYESIESSILEGISDYTNVKKSKLYNLMSSDAKKALNKLVIELKPTLNKIQ